jgi:hypothetical protein
MKKSTYKEHDRELVDGANQYVNYTEWAFELCN